jgi:peroxiredoxin Q/BCP
VKASALVASLVLFAVAACRKSDDSPPAPASSAAEAAGERSELLGVGAPLPGLSAQAHTGEQLRLSDLKGKPVVVYFYPKDDTPGCTLEAQEIRELHA